MPIRSAKKLKIFSKGFLGFDGNLDNLLGNLISLLIFWLIGETRNIIHKQNPPSQLPCLNYNNEEKSHLVLIENIFRPLVKYSWYLKINYHELRIEYVYLVTIVNLFVMNFENFINVWLVLKIKRLIKLFKLQNVEQVN